MKAPTSAEFTRLTQTLARRIGRYLERQGLLELDAENSYLAGDAGGAGALGEPKPKLPNVTSQFGERPAMGERRNRSRERAGRTPALDFKQSRMRSAEGWAGVQSERLRCAMDGYV